MSEENRALTILRLWNEGVNSKKLSKAVGCSRRTLNKLVAGFEAAGLVSRPPLEERLAGGRQWPEARTARLRELHAQGLPYSDIAQELGVSRGAVSGQAAKLGLVRDPMASEINRCRANAKNAEFLRAMNISRRGQPAPHLRGPRTPRDPSQPRPPRAEPKSYRPTEAQLQASKSLLELGPFHCRFPISEDAPGMMDGMRFCGCYRSAGKPYCDEHMRLTHKTPATTAEKFIQALRRHAA